MYNYIFGKTDETSESDSAYSRLVSFCKDHNIISLGLLMFALNLIKFLISVLSSHVWIVSFVNAVLD